MSGWSNPPHDVPPSGRPPRRQPHAVRGWRGCGGRRGSVPSRPPAFWLGLGLALLVMGCDSGEPVRRYTAERIPVAGKAKFPQRAEPATAAPRRKPQGNPTDRMLGAIVPRADQTWFFKLQGPLSATTDVLPVFLNFMTRLSFENDQPAWKLPEGWEQVESPVAGRFATIRVPLEPGPAELTVTALKSPASDVEEYVRLNVNRWRGQMSLPEQTAAEFVERKVSIQLQDGTPVWLVNLEGWLGSSGGRGTGGGRGPMADKGASPAPQPPAALPFKYEAPQEWTTAELNQFRLAAWRVTQGEQQVVITVSVAGGDLAGNLNRWRGQLQLPAAAEAELKSELETLQLGSAEGVYTRLHAPATAEKPQSILGVIATVRGQQWFFKLQGDSELAKAEEARFEKFVRSVRFP
ncbi:MAG: hypothetical protein ACKO3P_23580 [Planctomycetaceae bacterium]